jgi:Ni/Co efflux regulator RcnB
MSISGETVRNILIALVLTAIGVALKGGLSALGQAGSIFGGVASIFSSGGHPESPALPQQQQPVQAPTPQVQGPTPVAPPQVIYIIQAAPPPSPAQPSSANNQTESAAADRSGTNVQRTVDTAPQPSSDTYSRPGYGETGRYGAPYHHFKPGDYLPGYPVRQRSYAAGPEYAAPGFRPYPVYRSGPRPMVERYPRGYGRPMRSERRSGRAY